MTYEDLTYNRDYKYPAWALKFGWFLSISSIICIPIYALYRFIVVGGSFNEVSKPHLFYVIKMKKKFKLLDTIELHYF